MPTIFGPELAELTVRDVRSWLASASDEGLTWEAKGGQLRTEHVQRSASAFGNSVLGGYLILGAERASEQSPWELPGVDVRDELGVWISNSLRDIDNRPPFSVAGPWAVEAGRYVAVVAIRPSSTPPVMTPRGLGFERLVGTSPPVTDRASLARLFARGEFARREAERKSKDAALRALGPASDIGPPIAHFALALTATGGPDDRAAMLFSEAYGEQLKSVMQRLAGRAAVASPPRAQMWQDRLEAWLDDHDEEYRVSAWWDGSAVVSHRLGGGPDLLWAIASGLLEGSWRATAELVAAMGGYGPSHLAIVALDKDMGAGDRILLQRWTDEPAPPSQGWLDSVRRELRRAMGDYAPEP